MKFCTFTVNVLQKVQKISSHKLKDSNTTPITLRKRGLKKKKSRLRVTYLTAHAQRDQHEEEEEGPEGGDGETGHHIRKHDERQAWTCQYKESRKWHSRSTSVWNTHVSSTADQIDS